MFHRIVSALGASFFLLTAGAAAQFVRVPSSELVNALAGVRALSDSSFAQLVWWAPNPIDPGITVPDWNNSERQILQLKRHDRDAVLQWLTGNGRKALYARGATDAMIGARDPASFGASPGATPAARSRYRTLPLTSDALRSGVPPSGIVVNGGFALIARDGTKAIVCLSFTNVADRTATQVRFTFPLLDVNGANLGALSLVRTGEFSAHVAINGPPDANTYINNGPGPRAMFDNCVVADQGTAALPLLQTRYVTYAISAVRYADGSVWPQPTPAPTRARPSGLRIGRSHDFIERPS